MPIYDFCCPVCGTVKEDIFLSFQDFDKAKPKCHKCGKKMAVMIENVRVSLGKIGGGYPMRLCESCHRRDRVAAKYPSGCDNGKRCKGYVPFDASNARKRMPSEENLRKNYPDRLKNLRKGRTFTSKQILKPK